jgi:hypothetical protein
MATSDHPITAAEVIHMERLYWEERGPELASLQLRMDEFLLTAGERAMLHILNRELRWARVCRRWENKKWGT